jgi:hypothetical protein
MIKSAIFVALGFLVVLLCTATSHGDVAPGANPPQLPPSSAPAEPITGTPVTPNPGDETVVKDPFSPYSIGPPGTKAWAYKDLTPDEQAWADKTKDTTGWDSIHAQWGQAIQQQAQQAAAASAAAQLGLVDNSGGVGVVP